MIVLPGGAQIKEFSPSILEFGVYSHSNGREFFIDVFQEKMM
jgi:hypothetical protein